MKINKRILAREGLIIIAILLLLGATFIISAEFKQISDEEKAEIERESRLEASKEYGSVGQLNEKIEQDYSNMDGYVIERRVISIYQDKMTEKADRMDRITKNIYIFFIAVYPSYLVISFVVWSIKTLRIKS
jgi:hypothetical protein